MWISQVSLNLIFVARSYDVPSSIIYNVNGLHLHRSDDSFNSISIFSWRIVVYSDYFVDNRIFRYTNCSLRSVWCSITKHVYVVHSKYFKNCMNRFTILTIISTFFQFSNLLTILLILQIGVGIYGSINQDQAISVLDEVLNESLKVNNKTWEFVQNEVSLNFIVEIFAPIIDISYFSDLIVKMLWREWASWLGKYKSWLHRSIRLMLRSIRSKWENLYQGDRI